MNLVINRELFATNSNGGGSDSNLESVRKREKLKTRRRSQCRETQVELCSPGWRKLVYREILRLFFFWSQRVYTNTSSIR